MATRCIYSSALTPARWLALVACVVFTPSCVDAVVRDAPKSPTCKCAPPALCPVDVCDLQIELSTKTCADKVSKVEVMLGDELEPNLFTVGTPQRTCGTLPRGATRKLYARSDTSWQWIEEIACPPAAAGDKQGVTVVRVLNCATSPKP